MNDTKAWEVDTLRGHVNNVSCVLFHPRQELIISNSEDKSIRVWDMSKRQGVQTFRREHDRFWILGAHPDSNLLAAGHDGGMIVFKLERERPAYVPLGNGVLFVKDRYVRSYEYASAKDVPLMSIRRSGTGSSSVARTVHFNEQENMLLVCLDAEGGSYELYHVPRDGRSAEGGSQECKRGLGLSAVFVARQRFAVLDKNHQILIKNFQNEVTKKCQPPHPSTDYLYPAGTGSMLLKSEERITLFDIQQRKAMAEVTTPVVKYVIWSSDMSHVALLSKHAIVILTRKLEQVCMIHETIRIKSGAWDGNDLFVFSTLNHIKYLLVTGDHGIIRTLEEPLYITHVSGGTIHGLDREARVRKMAVDVTECAFKLSLYKKEFERVIRIIKQSKLSGHAIIAYLQKKGYPQVALHFVSDEQTRFNLAIECGNIEVALVAAHALDTKENWQKLGAEALKQGNHQVVENSYQKTKDMERLSFLYLITGNITKLRKMLTIAEMRSDVMGRFHNALYLGDVGERVKLLTEAGQLPLAYACAATHGLTEQAEALATQLEAAGIALPPPLTSAPRLLYPALPITRESNWPLLTVSRGPFDNANGEGGGGGGGGNLFGDAGVDLDEAGGGGGWGDDDILDLGDGPGGGGGGGGDMGELDGDDPFAGGGEEGGGGWADDELDLSGVPDAGVTSAGGYYVAPNPGPTPMSVWARDSQLVADHVAAGSFETAMQMMQRQLGIVNFAPLKPYFLALSGASLGVLGAAPSTPPLLAPLLRGPTMPRLALTLPAIVERLKAGYKVVTDGKFAEALEIFSGVLTATALTVVSSRQEVAHLKELQGICRDYIIALNLELLRKKTSEPKRAVELAAYFTHMNLQPAHTMLALKSAMTVAYKLKNFNTASSFARRLLELNPRQEISTQARKVIQLCDANPGDAVPLAYDERNPFVVCAASYVPIYRGSALVRCPFSKAAYLPEHKGKLGLCGLAEVGLEAPGLDENYVLER